MRNLIVILFFLPVAISIVNKCYSYSTSLSHHRTTKTQLTCGIGSVYCVKYTVNNIHRNEQTDLRTCGNAYVCPGIGCYQTFTGTTCCCAKDLCNSSTTMTAFYSFVGWIAVYLLFQ